MEEKKYNLNRYYSKEEGIENRERETIRERDKRVKDGSICVDLY